MSPNPVHCSWTPLLSKRWDNETSAGWLPDEELGACVKSPI